MRISHVIIACAMILPAIAVGRQHPIKGDSLLPLPNRFFERVSKTSYSLQAQMDKHTLRYLKKVKKAEQRIYQKLVSHQPAIADQLFKDAVGIGQLMDTAANVPGTGTYYLPFLDTLRTSLAFMQQYPRLMQQAGMQEKIKAGMAHLQALEERLGRSAAIEQLLKARVQNWYTQTPLPIVAKELEKLQRTIYYYGRQLQECRELLQHPARVERKVLDLLSHHKPFQDFMRRNSQLGALFRLPGNEAMPVDGASLQTRAEVGRLIQEQLTAGGPNARQAFQQQIEVAQTELRKLKDKLLAGTPTDAGMPAFQPNTQKTKSFKQRLELGTNLQSQQASQYFPVTTDIGLSLGYRINDRSVAGVGASYKVGWGQGWQHIRITHQGAGLRSFVDWKFKKSFWLSGGFEMNYRPVLYDNTLVPAPRIDLAPPSRWQQSGLLGLSKKYQAGKKFKGRMQLLWDFLSYQQLPRTRPLVFRVGYDLN